MLDVSLGQKGKIMRGQSMEWLPRLPYLFLEGYHLNQAYL